MDPKEGVIKFSYDHRPDELRMHHDLCYRLMAWRNIMRETALIGIDPLRYDGAGYGNISGRVAPFAAERGERRFLISGTQTGQLDCVSPADFCLVEFCDQRRNYVRSRGGTRPSSESMTHATVYDLDPRIRFVFHAHSPVIFKNCRRLGIPMTPTWVPYGTPQMCEAVRTLYRETNLGEDRVFCMGGHEDGVVVFGETADQVGSTMISRLAQAYEITARSRVQLCEYPQ